MKIFDSEITILAPAELKKLRAKNNFLGGGLKPCMTVDCEGFYGDDENGNYMKCIVCNKVHCLKCEIVIEPDEETKIHAFAF